MACKKSARSPSAISKKTFSLFQYINILHALYICKNFLIFNTYYLILYL